MTQYEIGELDLTAQVGAAQTATNYISFDSTNGLKIAQSGPSTATKLIQITPSSGILIKDDANNYAKISSNGLDMVQDGNNIASFGTTVRIGQNSANHLNIDSNGVEIFTDTSTSVAQFGASARIGTQDGSHMELSDAGMSMVGEDNVTLAMFSVNSAMIGAPGSTQLSLSSGELVGRTPQGLAVFTADLDVGTVTETVSTAMRYTAMYLASIGANKSATLGTTSTDLTFAGTGATAVWKSGQQRVVISFHSNNLRVTSIPTVLSGNCTVIDWVSGMIRLDSTADLTQSVGTLSSEVCTIRVPVRVSNTTDSSIQLRYIRRMTNTGKACVELSVYNEGGVALPVNSFGYIDFTGYFPEVSVSAQAPAFMFGDRYSNPGMYSAALGRGLRAASNYQTIVGKYNDVTDTNDDYAFVVGNGTANNARSNALIVHWDGTVELASPLPMASGGTGQSGTTVLTGTASATLSQVLTTTSGVTINDMRYAQWGKLAQVFIRATPSAAKSGTWTVCTMKPGKCPPFETPGDTGGTTATSMISADGTVSYRGTVAANTSCWVKVVYLIA